MISTTPSTTYTMTADDVTERVNRITRRLSRDTVTAINTGTASPEEQTALKDAIMGTLPTMEQIIDNRDAIKIVQTAHALVLNLTPHNYIRKEITREMRDMYGLSYEHDIVAELDRLTDSPAAKRVAELKTQHAEYRKRIQTALEEFTELANEYAEEQNACGQFERAMTTLRAIAPDGHDSLPRRMVSETVRVTELYDIELPRDDDGDADYSALDADEIRETGYGHGEEIEPY